MDAMLCSCDRRSRVRWGGEVLFGQYICMYCMASQVCNGQATSLLELSEAKLRPPDQEAYARR